MENDSVRTIGDNTMVDVWIDGRMRSITVPRGVIEAWAQLPPGGSMEMTDDERSDFVRAHLSRVVRAAKDRLHNGNPDTQTIVVQAAPTGSGGGDRRQGDRRKGDRRKTNLGPPRSGERRQC